MNNLWKYEDLIKSTAQWHRSDIRNGFTTLEEVKQNLINTLHVDDNDIPIVEAEVLRQVIAKLPKKYLIEN